MRERFFSLKRAAGMYNVWLFSHYCGEKATDKASLSVAREEPIYEDPDR